MVMLVNKKTFHQISSDLQLFLGDRTPSFIDWLQEIVAGGGTTEVAGNKTKLSGFTSYIHSIYSCVYNIIAALYSSCIWFSNVLIL